MYSERVEWANISRQYEQHRQEFMEAIEQVCSETAFSGGKYEAIFEKEFAEYCQVNGAAAVNNGTNALFLAMKSLGIGPGDEVIVPADTFIATAWGVSYNGAKPVFADIDPETFEISSQSVKDLITDKTKAIVGVHLYGQPFDIDTVKAIADENNLLLIEDCAQAHGAQYKGKSVGGLSNAGCFSFYPGKNLGSFGEGGAVTSNDPNVIRQVQRYKNHGADRRYYHDVIGYNMRMEGIQGAILTVKLKHLDAWNERRIQIAKIYQAGIHNSKIKLQVQPSWSKSVYHIMVAEVEDRAKFMEFLESKGIGCSIHYPIPCHLQNAYRNLGYKEGDLPVAEYHAKHCVSLPMFPELRNDEVERVIDACNKY